MLGPGLGVTHPFNYFQGLPIQYHVYISQISHLPWILSNVNVIKNWYYSSIENFPKGESLWQGVQPWALTKFPDFSLTFPWPFCGFPWPWDISSAFHYCLNTNFASNLTNHSPKVAITKQYQLGRLSKYKIWCFKLSQDCAQWQPSELNTLEGQTVLWFLIIFY